MTPFEQLQSRHEMLLARQAEAGTDLLDEVTDYVKDVHRESARVTSPQERAQLRANLRYWAGYVYDQTGAYPSTELAPTGTAVSAAPGDDLDIPFWRRRSLLLVVGLALLSLVCLGTIALFFFNQLNQQNVSATQQAEFTMVAVAELTRQRRAELAAAQATRSAATAQALGTGTPTATPTTPFFTATASPTPPPMATATTAPFVEYVVQPDDTLASIAQRYRVSASTLRRFNNLDSDQLAAGARLLIPTSTLPDTGGGPLPFSVVELTNLRDGDWVQEDTTLRGIYRDLESGWSIHVLVQPISRAGRLFPVDDFISVPDGEINGNWELTAAFPEPDQYNLFLVIAPDSDTRAALQAEELVALPENAFLFPDITTIFVGASQ